MSNELKCDFCEKVGADVVHFDARRYCQHNMERMGKMPNGQLVGLLMVCEIDSRDVKIEALKAELAELKAAARPVMKWWARYQQIMGMHCENIVDPVLCALDGDIGGSVTAAQLDALARLVGEE